MFAENLEFDHSLVPSERCDQASRNKITKRWGKHVQSPAKAVFFTSSPKDGAVSMDSQARRGTGFVQESELEEWPWVFLESSERASCAKKSASAYVRISDDVGKTWTIKIKTWNLRNIDRIAALFDIRLVSPTDCIFKDFGWSAKFLQFCSPPCPAELFFGESEYIKYWLHPWS